MFLTLMAEGVAAWDLGVELVMGKKERANDLFSKGKYVDACVLYGNAIESIMELEGYDDDKKPQNDFLNHLKPQLFLNLAISNYRMNEIDGALKSCNTALVFCKNPELYLGDLGVEEDLNEDIPFDVETIKIRADLYKTTSKVLYRRGLCKKAKLKGRPSEDALSQIRDDFYKALFYLPRDQDIQNALTEVTPLSLLKEDASSSSTSSKLEKSENSKASSLTSSEIHYMTVNGGKCLLRKAYWSQNITETKVYIPVTYLLRDLNFDVKRKGEETLENELRTQGWKVEFSQSEVNIAHDVYGMLLREQFEYDINKEESIWMVESGEEKGHGDLYMVLYLQKVPSQEKFPGCEWWDRVFKADEPIDTLTCTIGTDVNDLPDHAYRRSQAEDARFRALSKEEQEKELMDLMNVRKMFSLTEERIREAVEQEDKAIDEIPERAELLRTLRKQFPNIDFTAR